MATDGKLHINFDDNVLLYVVDKSDIPDYMGTLPREEQEKLNAKNDKWITDVLEHSILSTMEICPCQMQDFMIKNERKRQIMNIPPQAFQPTLDQSDIDKYRYAVIVIADKDEMQEVSAIIRECKVCHKISYWGNVAIFGKLLADITNNFYSKVADSGDPFDAELGGAETVDPNETMDVEVTDDNPLGENTLLEDLGSDAPIETETIATEEDASKQTEE